MDKYEYKGKEYELLHDFAQVKDELTRSWTSCVVYKQIESGMIFVRENVEFHRLFKLVE